MIHCRLTTVLLLMFVAVVTEPARSQVQSGQAQPTASGSPAKAKTQPDRLTWLRSLAEGMRVAQRRREPIVVFFSTESSPWHLKQYQETLEKTADDELSRWTRVYLSPNKSAKETRHLVVDETPAFRLLTSAGRLVAFRDGFQTGPELSKWMKEHYEEAILRAGNELTDKGPLDSGKVEQLLQDLKSREPAIRETAVRKLLPHRQVAARAAVAAFAQGSLQERLAVLELLRAWQAPLPVLDPWRPETCTDARLAALKKWAQTAATSGVVAAPTPAELAILRQEILRMVQADEVSALASRENLARHGRALLPEVSLMIKDASSDQARERLTALRYRLVASDALVLEWPGGLERLAATQGDARHQAVVDLVARATPDDEPLLLELFSNPDPLVRELSLRALQKIADPNAIQALLELLKDPEPNIRAAVLKQLAERPLRSMVPRIVAYIPQEKDPDLVIHAIRFLKASKSEESLPSLKTLLSHANWSVRAESAEALKTLFHKSAVAEELQADVCVALIDRLNDPDSFVASKSIEALQEADLQMAVEPMVQAALKNLRLAPQIVGALAAGSRMQRAALPHLREFCRHADANVRAAAIQGVCKAAPLEAQADLQAALHDRDSWVRRAGASGVFTVQLSLGRRSGSPSLEVNQDSWREEVRSGRRGPSWLKTLAPLLTPMLSSANRWDRVAAARPLIALGIDEPALPALVNAAKADPDTHRATCFLLPWLPWEKRLLLFEAIAETNTDPEQLAESIREFVKISDRRAAEPLWKLSTTPKANPEVAQAILASLKSIYDSEFRSVPAEAKLIADAARPRAMAGSMTQRRIALALLASKAPTVAADVSRPIAENTHEDAILRQNALQAFLLSLPKAAGVHEAVTHLSSDSIRIRRLSVQFLAMGPGPRQIHTLYPDQLVIDIVSSSVNERRGRETFLMEAPKDLRPEMLTELSKDTNPQAAASAGYLLVLLGKPEGLDPLMAHWRRYGFNDETAVHLLYRAIAILNDDRKVPVLEAIYRRLGKSDSRVSGFYWTIRGMDGPNALRLRKTIQQEVGMERLR